MKMLEARPGRLPYLLAVMPCSHGSFSVCLWPMQVVQES
jgi:hypothetical protein